MKSVTSNELNRPETSRGTVRCPLYFLSEVFVCIWSLEKDRSHSSSWYWRSIHRKFAICSSFGTANYLNQVFAIIWKWVKLWNSDNIIRYLDDQKELVAHILWFRSTHEYYETAKYEGHPTTGDWDRALNSVCSNIVIPDTRLSDQLYWLLQWVGWE